MAGFSVVTDHYGYCALNFREYRTTYAVCRFSSVASKWTPIDVAASESEAISKCKYLEVTKGHKTK